MRMVCRRTRSRCSNNWAVNYAETLSTRDLAATIDRYHLRPHLARDRQATKIAKRSWSNSPRHSVIVWPTLGQILVDLGLPRSHPMGPLIKQHSRLGLVDNRFVHGEVGQQALRGGVLGVAARAKPNSPGSFHALAVWDDQDVGDPGLDQKRAVAAVAYQIFAGLKIDHNQVATPIPRLWRSSLSGDEVAGLATVTEPEVSVTCSGLIGQSLVLQP